jgi:DNA modification methylase
MGMCGWKLKTSKIWIKSLKMNTFRSNFMYILTFQKKPHKVNMTKEFKVDVFHDESRYNTKGYSYGMSQKVCELALLEHSAEGGRVYDPFMGSGTTACAAIKTNRKYLGSEISQKYADIAENRIKGIDKS